MLSLTKSGCKFSIFNQWLFYGPVGCSMGHWLLSGPIGFSMGPLASIWAYWLFYGRIGCCMGPLAVLWTRWMLYGPGQLERSSLVLPRSAHPPGISCQPTCNMSVSLGLFSASA